MPLPSVESLHALTQGAGAQALAAAMSMHAPGPAEVQRLRREVSADIAAAALEVSAARRSLRGRVADWSLWWVDREGAAQASDDASAAWKAQRFANAGPAIDLCCGAGADLRAMGRVTVARGIDLRAERCWMAQRNAAVPATCADALTLDFDERVAHIDPARRDEASGRRHHDWDRLVPGADFLLTLAHRLDGLMVKLGPGIEVPADARPRGAELAFLSRHRALTQAALCTGALARHPGCNTAVLLDHALVRSGAPTWNAVRGDPTWPASDAWQRWIAEPDPSLERSGLLAMVAREEGLRERAPGLGLCTRDEPPNDHSPWFRWFECIETCPARLDHLQRRLRDLHAGTVDVKVRGHAADADAWSRALRGEGSESLVVFVHRIGTGTEAVVARRREPSATDASLAR